jgi:hypothetical protein
MNNYEVEFSDGTVREVFKINAAGPLQAAVAAGICLNQDSHLYRKALRGEADVEVRRVAKRRETVITVTPYRFTALPDESREKTTREDS